MADDKNIYLLTGEDVLKEEFIEDLIGKYIPEETREFNVEILNGEEMDSASLLQRLHSLPLFSHYRVLIVREMEKLKKTEQEKLAKAWRQIPTSTILIISVTNKEGISKGLLERMKDSLIERDFSFSRKRSVALEEKKQWIEQEVRKRGARINPDALETLAQAPMELRQLRNEIEKLCAFVQGGTISLEDVREVMTNVEEVRVYELTNAVFQGKGVEAMRLLDLLLEMGDIWTPLLIIQTFASHVRLLFQAKILQENGIPLLKERRKGKVELTSPEPEEIPPQIREVLLEGEENIVQYLQRRPWMGESLSAQARRFSKRALLVILRLLHRLDQEIKQGADPRERLEWFIFRLSKLSPTGEKGSGRG